MAALVYSQKLEPAAKAIHENPRTTRYVVLHGGRGSGKSHFFAEQVILRCKKETTRVVCIRAVQKSLDESVLRLLVTKIEKFGDTANWTFKNDTLFGPNNSQIIFRGLSSYNASNIKSLEDIDICWIEEGQDITKNSWDILRPTIRKKDPRSQIWVSYNPANQDDAVDLYFRGGKKNKNAVVVEINYMDNAHMSVDDPLVEDLKHDYATDRELFDWIWLGGYRKFSVGALLLKDMKRADKENRIGNFPYNPDLPVYTSWDIGVADPTSIIFWQVEDEYTNPKVKIIDYYEETDTGLDEIVKVILAKPYTYKKHFFPHDIKNREWGAGAKERINLAINYGIDPQTIIVCKSKHDEDALAAAKDILKVTYFNTNNSQVAYVVDHLRKLSRKYNKSLGTFDNRVWHNEHSHCFSAFADFAINSNIEVKKKPIEMKPVEIKGMDDWTYDEYLGSIEVKEESFALL